MNALERTASASWDRRSEQWGCLMAAAQGGESHAYEQLFRELDSWLRRYYARRLPGAAADDARQDALLAIHAGRHVYAPSRPFGPWVAAIARYKWIDHVRDLVLRRLAHQDLRAALGQAVVGHQPSLQFGRGLLERLQQRTRAAEHHHVRVGLEDAPLGSPMSNLAWVEEAVRLVRQEGAEPASGAEVRQALGSLALAA